MYGAAPLTALSNLSCSSLLHTVTEQRLLSLALTMLSYVWMHFSIHNLISNVLCCVLAVTIILTHSPPVYRHSMMDKPLPQTVLSVLAPSACQK